MRGKDYSTGLRGVLFEVPHYERMGAAIWLYGWLVLRETHESGGVGYVLGGSPVSYREIEEETGFNRRTVERWMRTLRVQGYIATETTTNGIAIQIQKAKKFRRFPQFPQAVNRGVRKSAEPPDKSAGGAPQNCVANDADCSSLQQYAAPMGSSSVEGLDKEEPRPHQPAFKKDGCECRECRSHREAQTASAAARANAHGGAYATEPPLTARELLELTRAQLQLLRAEREEAVRRELRVGANPARGE